MRLPGSTRLWPVAVFLACVFSSSSVWSAARWPTGIDYRLELTGPSRTAAKSGFARLTSFERLRLFVPADARVFNEKGQVAASRVILGRNGAYELWFPAEPDQRYYLGWSAISPVRPKSTGSADLSLPMLTRSEWRRYAELDEEGNPKPVQNPEAPKAIPPRKPLPPDESKAEAAAAASETRRQRPSGWDTSTPVAEFRPGALWSRPAWSISEGQLVQSSKRRLEYLVSQEQFGDFELSLRVRPLGPGKAGVALRIDDPESPTTSGVVRLIGVARSGRAQTGLHETRGIVRADGEGATFLPLNWNTLLIRCVGRNIEVTVNREKCSSVVLPAGAAKTGAIALITSGAGFAFDDVKLRELPSEKVLIGESFETAGPPSDKVWRSSGSSDGRQGRGFVRLTNTAKRSIQFETEFRHHEAPWIYRPKGSQEESLSVGQSSPWIWLEDLPEISAPCTLTFNIETSKIADSKEPKSPPAAKKGTTVVPKKPSPEVSEPAAVGQIEFHRTLIGTPADLVRRIPVDSDSASVEIQQLNPQSESDLRTTAEIGAKLLRQVRAMKFKGRPPQKFPIGSSSLLPDDLEAGRLLGFNAVGGRPLNFPAPLFHKLEYRYLLTGTTALENRTLDYGYNLEALIGEFRKFNTTWSRQGPVDRMYCLNLYDGVQLDLDGQLRKANPANLVVDSAAWKLMMKVAGLKPSDFIDPANPPDKAADPESPEYWSKLRAVHPKDWRSDPAGAAKTLKLISSIWPARFQNAREAMRQALRSGILSTARVDADQYLRLGLGGFDPWVIYGSPQGLESPQACDRAGESPSDEEFLIDLQRCALNGQSRPVIGCLAGPLLPPSLPADRSAANLEERAMSALGAGARSLLFIDWGPRWQAEDRWYSDDPRRLEIVGRVSHAAGWVDDILRDGRPEQGQLGIVVSPLSDAWDFALRDQEPVDHVAERRHLHHLLRSLHYQVDFLHERMLPRDFELERYKVLFISQPCLLAETANRLQGWVNRGGTLIGICDIGQYDENCQLQKGMLAPFGIKELDWHAPQTRMLSSPKGSTVSLDQRVRKIVPSDAKVVASFSTGEPAITRKAQAKGQYVFCGFSPGKLQELSWNPTARNEAPQAALRDLISPLVATAGLPVCRTNHPLVSARVIRSYHGSAVFLVNLSGEPVAKVRVSLETPGIKTGESLQQGALKLTGEKTCEFELPLDKTDVIRLK